MPKPAAATHRRLLQISRHGRVEFTAKVAEVSTRPAWKNRPLPTWVLTQVRLLDGREYLGSTTVDIPHAGRWFDIGAGERIKFEARLEALPLPPPSPHSRAAALNPGFRLRRITQLHRRGDDKEWQPVRPPVKAPR